MPRHVHEARLAGGRPVRPAAVAGTFYPDDARTLARWVDAALADGRSRLPPQAPPLRALIGPHAGYVYSGAVAGSAYAAAEARRGRVRRVVLIGPSHYVAFEGLAVAAADAFATPLGEAPIDRAAVEAALQLPHAVVLPQAHEREHALETHLPFMQRALGTVAIVPVVVGDADPAWIAALLARLADDDTLVAVSSDLSHYLDHDAAAALDRRTADAIERLDAAAIGPTQACGRLAIQGLLQWARRQGWSARTLDLRNSGDAPVSSLPGRAAGGRDRVVGYGAFLLG